ncbi:lipopolysaccharide assembly protein LapB [Teredinibacter haidensis]|uniref:lipopolysaccharide assembly protein LapB n=1 Tax=Teredinibacter haidensis TaxID=2731755 RepID=UPI000948E20D|nr:lipopolysaccharide assembly protein LapB [Teredinibacter haidensis]
MKELLVFIFLFIALGLGFGMGRYTRRLRHPLVENNRKLSEQSYYQGLTYLLNDEPDAEIDTFIAALDVNSDTLETHLALGNLLRKRGEVARAIRIHQNLLSRPSLSKSQLHIAQLELAVDYLKSGLLDRAEILFKELADVRGLEKTIREKALAFLLEVYEDTHEWLAAIDVADRLTASKFAGTPDIWRERQAHYCCELADKALEQNDCENTRRLLRNALRYDKTCARAALLQARVELKQGAGLVALTLLRKLPYQNPQFVSEVLPLIYESFKELNSPAEMTVMYQEIYGLNNNLQTLSYLAKSIAEEQGEGKVVDFLLHELQAFPQMEAAGELLKLVAENHTQWKGFSYNMITGVLEKLTKDRSLYNCSNCGFEGEQLHWLCPSCKSWSTIAQR